MADLALANAAADRTGGERHQLVVHVDAQTLAADADGRCELSAGTSDATIIPLAAETARRLACDASIVTLIERDGRPLALGRKRRSVSPALRRALETRDRGCRYPGCNSTRFVEAHHIEHWAQGGATDLGNLILLCRRHHRLLHEQGYSIRLDGDAEPRFVNRHGVPVPSVPRPPPPSRPDALRRRHRHLAITGETTWSGTGDRADLGLAVDAIAAATAPRSRGVTRSGSRETRTHEGPRKRGPGAGRVALMPAVRPTWPPPPVGRRGGVDPVFQGCSTFRKVKGASVCRP